MLSQTSEVLEHLRKEGSITSIEAINLYGATRLSAIIFELRKNYAIETMMVEGKTRYGRDCRFAKYIYKGRL